MMPVALGYVKLSYIFVSCGGLTDDGQTIQPLVNRGYRRNGVGLVSAAIVESWLDKARLGARYHFGQGVVAETHCNFLSQLGAYARVKSIEKVAGSSWQVYQV